MKYITFSDMADTVRRNIWKIPHDIDFVIGVPRSGMLCGTMVSELINVPLVDINSFCNGVNPSGGLRCKSPGQKSNKVLVMDDTVYNGTSMRKSKKLLEPFKDKYEFIYCCTYLEGTAVDEVDIYLEDVRQYTNQYSIVLYEWNIFHHNSNFMSRCMYDMDGVLCVDPPDERNEKEYIEYIKNAKPLIVPTVPIGAVCTYRLVKNQEITKQWLSEYNIRYGNLIMFNAQTYEDRQNSGVLPEEMKGHIYKDDTDMILFVESSDYQARRIYEISKKPVLCIEKNILYGGE